MKGREGTSKIRQVVLRKEKAFLPPSLSGRPRGPTRGQGGRGLTPPKVVDLELQRERGVDPRTKEGAMIPRNEGSDGGRRFLRCHTPRESSMRSNVREKSGG